MKYLKTIKNRDVILGYHEKDTRMKFGTEYLRGYTQMQPSRYTASEAKQYRFVSGDLNRIKGLYEDFEPSFFNHILKDIQYTITYNLNVSQLLFIASKNELNRYIRNLLIIEDPTALQFTEPIEAVDTFGDIDVTVEKFSKLLLPGIQKVVKSVQKHDEQFILKSFTDYLTSEKPSQFSIDNRIKKNVTIQNSDVKLDFNYAWQNESLHLVKPISFDLSEAQNIQTKAAQMFGYLTLLGEEATNKNYNFDLLVAPPQNPKLEKPYNDALNILNKAKAPKNIIKGGREILEYSKYAVKHIFEDYPSVSIN